MQQVEITVLQVLCEKDGWHDWTDGSIEISFSSSVAVLQHISMQSVAACTQSGRIQGLGFALTAS